MSANAARPATRPATESKLQQRLSAASAHCSSRGAQLTPQRTEVLELMLRRGGQAKAYDLQDDMQARHGRIAPTTVYRALEFLQEHHLIHKADAANTFVVCQHADHAHPALLLICTRCGRVDELHEAKALTAVMSEMTQLGVTPESVEIKHTCADCLQAASANA